MEIEVGMQCVFLFLMDDPPTATDPLAQYSVALLLSYSLSLFCGGWLSSSPTRSLSLVEGGAWEGRRKPRAGGSETAVLAGSNHEKPHAPSDPDRTAGLRVGGGPGCDRWEGGACPRLWSM